MNLLNKFCFFFWKYLSKLFYCSLLSKKITDCFENSIDYRIRKAFYRGLLFWHQITGRRPCGHSVDRVIRLAGYKSICPSHIWQAREVTSPDKINRSPHTLQTSTWEKSCTSKLASAATRLELRYLHFLKYFDFTHRSTFLNNTHFCRLVTLSRTFLGSNHNRPFEASHTLTAIGLHMNTCHLVMAPNTSFDCQYASISTFNTVSPVMC